VPMRDQEDAEPATAETDTQP